MAELKTKLNDASVDKFLQTVKDEGYEELLGQPGKHSLGKDCLYIRKLADADTRVLKNLITNSARRVKQA